MQCKAILLHFSTPHWVHTHSWVWAVAVVSMVVFHNWNGFHDKLPDPSIRLPVFLFRIITYEVAILSEHFIVIIIQLTFRYSVLMYLVAPCSDNEVKLRAKEKQTDANEASNRKSQWKPALRYWFPSSNMRHVLPIKHHLNDLLYMRCMFMNWMPPWLQKKNPSS